MQDSPAPKCPFCESQLLGNQSSIDSHVPDTTNRAPTHGVISDAYIWEQLELGAGYNDIVQNVISQTGLATRNAYAVTRDVTELFRRTTAPRPKEQHWRPKTRFSMMALLFLTSALVWLIFWLVENEPRPFREWLPRWGTAMTIAAFTSALAAAVAW